MLLTCAEVSESASGPIASIKVTPEEVKSMMKNMTEKAFSSYQVGTHSHDTCAFSAQHIWGVLF